MLNLPQLIIFPDYFCWTLIPIESRFSEQSLSRRINVDFYLLILRWSDQSR